MRSVDGGVAYTWAYKKDSRPPGPAFKCRSDMDYSLNGRCSLDTGKCDCLAAWYGPR